MSLFGKMLDSAFKTAKAVSKETKATRRQPKNNSVFHNVRQTSNDAFQADITINGEVYTRKFDMSPEVIAQKKRNRASINSPVPAGCVRKNIKSFTSTYLSCIPIDIFDECDSREIDGYTYIDLPIYTFEDIKSKRAEFKKQERVMAKCAELNNEGIAFEKAGNVASAIKIYEKNIDIGYPAHHSYKRLMVLYSKAKDFQNEKRVIERALEVFPEFEQYKNRLLKVENRISK